MDDSELQGEDIEVHKNVQGHMDCKGLCEGNGECSFWTHISGVCYLKTNDVFTVRQPDAISGEKNCSGSGNNLRFLYSHHMFLNNACVCI